MTLQQRLAQEFVDAQKARIGAEQLIERIYPETRDPRMFLGVLEMLAKAVRLAASAVLKAEFVRRKIDLGESAFENLDTFFTHYGGKFGISRVEQECLKELLVMHKVHVQSTCEFVVKGKIAMMDDEGNVVRIGLKGVRKFLRVTTKLLRSTQESFRGGF